MKADNDRRREALALNNEVAAHLRDGKADKALPLLRRALGLDPDEAGILLNLGGAYVLLGRYDEAVPVLRRASEAAPEDPMVWCNLGAALLRLPGKNVEVDREQAIAAFERSLELDPAAANVAYNLGLVHRDRGDFGAAAAAFRRALEADPDDGDAKLMLERMESLLAGRDRCEDGCGSTN